MVGARKKTRKVRADKGIPRGPQDHGEQRRGFAASERTFAASERTLTDNLIEREARVLAFAHRAEIAGKCERFPIASPLEAHEVARFRSDACDTVYARMLSHAHHPRRSTSPVGLLRLIDSHGAFLRAVDLPTVFRLPLHESFVSGSLNAPEVLHFIQTAVDSGYVELAACGLCWQVNREVLFVGHIERNTRDN